TEASADEAETVEEDASVLGLGEEDEKFLDVRDTDEQQK
ncbi:MAG: preprotein translocase subunit YajC, partial [Thermobifida sp.]|nr:preprotein translocase subunit YajC [Thermobifida sp.]